MILKGWDVAIAFFELWQILLTKIINSEKRYCEHLYIYAALFQKKTKPRKCFCQLLSSGMFFVWLSSWLPRSSWIVLLSMNRARWLTVAWLSRMVILPRSSILPFRISFLRRMMAGSNDWQQLSLSHEKREPKLPFHTVFNEYDKLKSNQEPSMCRSKDPIKDPWLQFQRKLKLDTPLGSDSNPCDDDHRLHLSCGGPEILVQIVNPSPMRKLQKVVNCVKGN